MFKIKQIEGRNKTQRAFNRATAKREYLNWLQNKRDRDRLNAGLKLRRR